MSIYAFTSPLSRFYINFLWGENFSSSFPCEAIYTAKASFNQVAIPVKCLFSRRRNLYTLAWNILLWVLLILFFLFIIGISCMDLHVGFFVPTHGADQFGERGIRCYHSIY